MRADNNTLVQDTPQCNINSDGRAKPSPEGFLVAPSNTCKQCVIARVRSAITWNGGVKEAIHWCTSTHRWLRGGRKLRGLAGLGNELDDLVEVRELLGLQLGVHNSAVNGNLHPQARESRRVRLERTCEVGGVCVTRISISVGEIARFVGLLGSNSLRISPQKSFHGRHRQ